MVTIMDTSTIVEDSPVGGGISSISAASIVESNVKLIENKEL